MQKVLTAAEMREVDRLTTEKYGIPSILLMENAAHAAARIITEKLGGSVAGKSFLILCGKGNNGGDGAALARILWTQGADVFVFLLGKINETKGDAQVNFEIIKKIADEQGLFFKEVCDWAEYFAAYEKYFRKTEKFPETIVDAVFGTGLSRKLDNFYKVILSEFYDFIVSNKLIVSLDLPTGLDSDAALFFEPGASIRANLTVTFTAPKPANVLAPASNFNGKLVVTSIGSPQELIDNSPSKLFLAEKSDAQNWLEKTKFTSASYKNKRGHALVVGGAKNYAGAAILSGNAAIVSGVGLATVAAPESVHNAVASRMLPEVMTRSVTETPNGAIAREAADEILEFIEGKIDAVAVGSGMSSSEESTRQFARDFVERRKTPVVIDADALNSLAPFDLQGSDEFPLILTPHEGEFLKLLGTKDKEAIKDRVKAAREFAEKHNVILVMKGECSLIAAPDGRVVVNPTGNSGLGKAGNGDTLVGIIVGFVAQAVQMKVDIFETVVAAIYIAGFAADIAEKKYGKRSMLASDVRECLQEAFETITS
jgi:NAD(P)H-hydrate epimerase